MATPTIDVYVKLPTGRTSVLNLLPNDQVKQINEKVANEEGIPSLRMRMKYQGKILDKYKTIGYLGIRSETILKADIVVPREFRVYVQTRDGSPVGVEINNTVTLKELQDITERLDIVSTKKIKHFKHSGRIYKPDSTPLFETSIGEESTIEVSFEEIQESNTETREDVVDEDLKDIVLSSFQSNGRNVEVVFSFDTTGSMSIFLEQVRKKLRETCQRLLRDIPNIRIGIIAHGDYCDYKNYEYILKIQDLTSDVQQLVDFADKTPSTGGGGNGGECYEWMLYHAKSLDWSEDSAKALVVIGDDVPHIPSYTDQNLNWHTELDILKGMDVKVYGVYCNTACGTSHAEHFYEELADRTGGCFLQLHGFDLITEMFLGVCYKESNQEQLEAFTEELKEKREGELDKATETLIKQLEDTKSTDKPVSEEIALDYMTKYSYSWWNFQNSSNETPMFYYDKEKDSWSGSDSDLDYNYTSPCIYMPNNNRRKRHKKKCSIM